jgi:hypothetical protein
MYTFIQYGWILVDLRLWNKTVNRSIIGQSQVKKRSITGQQQVNKRSITDKISTII